MQKDATVPEAQRDELKNLLAEIPLDTDLRARGIDEATIAKCEAVIQAACDAQRADRKPAGPRMQPAEGSVEETRMVAASVKAGNAVADATAAYGGLAGSSSPVAEVLEGKRVSLWILEGLRNKTWTAPRVSIISRALVELTSKSFRAKDIVPTNIYNKIWERGRIHLSQILANLLKKIGVIPTGDVPTLGASTSSAAGHKPCKSKQSALSGDIAGKLRRHIRPRLDVLADLGYVERDAESNPKYLPTDLGRDVMNGWPEWDADPTDTRGGGRAPPKPSS